MHQTEQIRNLLLDNKVNDNLLCCLCSQLAIQPVECGSCQNLFCTKCMEEWQQTQKLCPLQCSLTPLSLKPPHKIVRSVFQKLRLNCPNQGLGCCEIVQLNTLEGHLKDQCDFQLTECQYQNCDQKVLRKYSYEHQAQCIHKSIHCQYCQQLVLVKQRQDHNCIKSLIGLIQSQSQEIQKLKLELLGHKEQQNRILTKITNLEQRYSLDQNRCKNMHQLTLAPQLIQATCEGCSKLNALIRNICNICGFKYCLKCKPILLFKGMCQLGHKYINESAYLPHRICNVCQQVVGKGNKQIWVDSVCNTDVCDACYTTLNQ